MKTITIRAELDPNKCVGCSTCIHVCPVSAIRLNPARPIERTKASPCSDRCPAGNDIEGFLRLTAQGKFEDALRLVTRTNPFPAITGRVCFHPCEEGCNRKAIDGAVSILQMERKLSEYERLQNPGPIVPRKERIAVVGSGPAGLTCAYYLLQGGYRVTMFESQPLLGGWLRYGIPEYRLPRRILDQEIAKLMRLGLAVKASTRVGVDVPFPELEAFDSVFIASGRHHDRKLNIPGEESSDVFSGGKFLNQARGGEVHPLGKKVVVIGGGNSAVDSARVALRLGSETVLIYRRSRSEMPAYASEVQEMEEEGAKIVFLASPIRFALENGRMRAVECVGMELQEPDGDGRRKAVPVPGRNFTFAADSGIVAIGEEPDLSYLPSDFPIENEKIKAGPFGETNRNKIFVGGDLTSATGSVPAAIRTGRMASQAIDAYLNAGKPSQSPNLEVVRLEQMNVDFFDPQEKNFPARLPFETAVQGFGEIYSGFNDETAREEGKRCFGCASLPIFNSDDCRGCGNCEQRCPTLAIQMKPLDTPVVVRVEIAKSDPRTVNDLCRRANLHPKSIVCFCTTTRAEEISAAILQGARTPEEISLRTGARTGCSVLCIQPIFRLLEAARLPFQEPASADVWYRTIPNIWEISQEIKDKYDKTGFRFGEDLQFFEKLIKS